MGSHVTVNGLGLTHKGSVGVSIATLPDVCKTPSPAGPIPIPYPNFADHGSLSGGSTTVKVKNNMIGTKGSEYSRSSGDEAGTAGGVTSSTFMKETAWITFSFDVKIDGQNACRHTDKKFHNHKNTVDMAGNLDWAPTAVQAEGLLCMIFCECKAESQAKKFETSVDPASFDAPDFGADPGAGPGRAQNQACVERKFNKDYKNTNLRAEQSYDMTTNPPSPVAGRPSGTRRPDFVRVQDPKLPAQAPNIDVFEMKFPGDSYGAQQEEDYERIGGGKPVTTLDSKTCGC